MTIREDGDVVTLTLPRRAVVALAGLARGAGLAAALVAAVWVLDAAVARWHPRGWG